MSQTVREFIYQSYRLINASNPVVPLHGDDQNLMLTILNQLLAAYASTGLLLTIATTASVPVTIGDNRVICGPTTYTPPPNVPFINLGRLANLDSAWLLLDGVTYPLKDESRDIYLGSYKYEPLQGLPTFVIVFPETQAVVIRMYPAPSQPFLFYLRGKFQFSPLTINDDLNLLPDYYSTFFLLAVARHTAFFKGRAQAWTADLQELYKEARDMMEAASEVNLAIEDRLPSLLNGNWRVMAGV